MSHLNLAIIGLTDAVAKCGPDHALDVARCANMLKRAAEGDTMLSIADLFLEIAFKPTIPTSPVVKGHVCELADAIAKDLRNVAPGFTKNLAANIMLLKGLAAGSSMGPVAMLAIDAINLDEPTTVRSQYDHTDRPVLLQTPLGLLKADLMNNQLIDKDHRAYRIGLEAHHGRIRIPFGDKHYDTYAAARKELMRLFMPHQAEA